MKLEDGAGHRLISDTTPAVSYSYDTGSNGIGQLTGVSSNCLSTGYTAFDVSLGSSDSKLIYYGTFTVGGGVGGKSAAGVITNTLVTQFCGVY